MMRAKVGNVEFEVETKEEAEWLVEIGNATEEVPELEPEPAKAEAQRAYMGKSKLKKQKNKHWSSEDDEFLRENRDMPVKKLAKLLGRTKVAIRVRLSHSHIPRAKAIAPPKGVSKEQKKVLALFKDGKTREEMATELGIPISRVYYHVWRLRQLGLVSATGTEKKRKGVKHFTEDELKYIRENVGKVSIYSMAKHLGRHPSSVHGKLKTLDLTKPGPAYDSLEKKERKAKKALTFDALTRHPELQQVASDLVISCASQKIPLKLADLVNVLDLDEGEAKVLLVDIFNNQNKIYKFLGRPNGKIIWKADELNFR